MSEKKYDSSEDLIREFEKLRRFDLVSETKIVDEDKRIVQIISVPHPDRYDHLIENGQTLYVDRYLKEAVQLESMVDGAISSPVYASERVIDSTQEYAESRLLAMERELQTGTHVLPDKIARSNQPLQASESSKLLSFISVDAVGSTVLRALHGSRFDRSIEFLLREIGSLAAVFGASVLKFTGDGLIIYVDHPSFNVTADTTNDLAVSILQFMHHSFRTALQEADLPVFDLRIGADLGPAVVKDFVVPATNFKQLDIASDALNRAKKLDQIAPKNSIRIGWHLYRLSHVQWLKRSTAVDERIKGMEDYRVFELT
ncbi:hypothetical protein N9Y45_04000 [Erythrobacter sp.]|nr:hypothetical protein [Erythrobacter sp.]